MFERYTENARRVIFFARYEALGLRSPLIETGHLLLGLMREDRANAIPFLRLNTTVELLRTEVEQSSKPREGTSHSVDLPLSDECKRVLAYAAEEAERLLHRHISTEHLILGLLREGDSFAGKFLHGMGLELASLREEIHKAPETLARAKAREQIKTPASNANGSASIQTGLGRFELALNVANLEASVDFYRKLGFTAVATGAKSEGIVVIQNGFCRIALCQGHILDNVLNFRGGDVAAIAKRATEAGLTFEKPPFRGEDGATAALLRDPDGNAIYLVSPHGEDR